MKGKMLPDFYHGNTVKIPNFQSPSKALMMATHHPKTISVYNKEVSLIVYLLIMRQKDEGKT